MPYISKTRRKEILQDTHSVKTPGELNFLLTEICLRYLVDNGGPSYMRYNEIIGVLECAKFELYRRAVVPYEEEKIRINGDVYSSTITGDWT